MDFPVAAATQQDKSFIAVNITTDFFCAQECQ